MIKGIISAAEKKFANTVFGEAVAGIKYLYGKNKKIFSVEMLLTYIVTIFITGRVILAFENMSGHGYLISIQNIFGIWLRSGILPSLIVFILLQVAIFRAIRLFRIKYKRDEEGNYNTSTEGTYGTAGKMTEEELKKTFILEPIDSIKANIFGKNPFNLNQMVGQREDLLKINRNVLITAGPNAGKSATIVINLLFQIIRRGESAIVSDPKSELFKIVAELAKLLGYEVRILNLNSKFLGNSDPCNYMMYVGDDVDKAQVLANAIIANTTGGKDLLDFWNEGALNLLQAIILRINVGNDYLDEQKNLPMLFTYITQHTLEEMEADFSGLNHRHPAYAPWLIFKDGDDKPKKQVLQGLRIKLKLFNSEKLRRILSETKGSIDIKNPGRKKCLYFIGSSDQTSTMSSMISLFYTLLYQELVDYADERMDGKLPVTVHMVLDEYANMGTIPDFQKKLSTVRSRNIVTYIVIQDINQLKEKHPFDTWKTVINDCDYHILLKTNDQDTMTWWNEMCGESTVNVTNIVHEKSKTDILDIHNAERITDGQGKRNVYTKDEIRKLKEDELLLLVSQRDSVKIKTLFWKDHPYGKYLEQHPDMYILPAQHYPLWRLIEDGIVDKNFDYDNGPTYVMEMKPDEKIEIDKNYDPDSILGIRKTVGTKTKEKITKLVKHKIEKKKQEIKKKVKFSSLEEAAKNSAESSKSAKYEKVTVSNTIAEKQTAIEKPTEEKKIKPVKPVIPNPIPEPIKEGGKSKEENKEVPIAKPLFVEQPITRPVTVGQEKKQEVPQTNEEPLAKSFFEELPDFFNDDDSINMDDFN